MKVSQEVVQQPVVQDNKFALEVIGAAAPLSIHNPKNATEKTTTVMAKLMKPSQTKARHVLLELAHVDEREKESATAHKTGPFVTQHQVLPLQKNAMVSTMTAMDKLTRHSPTLEIHAQLELVHVDEQEKESVTAHRTGPLAAQRQVPLLQKSVMVSTMTVTDELTRPSQI
tara:strand:- start:653 stop:1165 length:513 start_codon:yes stop_codon:yes gene_type:complete